MLHWTKLLVVTHKIPRAYAGWEPTDHVKQWHHKAMWEGSDSSRPHADELVVILYSFRGTSVAVGKWLRASTHVFGQLVCNIIKFHSWTREAVRTSWCLNFKFSFCLTYAILLQYLKLAKVDMGPQILRKCFPAQRSVLGDTIPHHLCVRTGWEYVFFMALFMAALQSCIANAMCLIRSERNHNLKDCMVFHRSVGFSFTGSGKPNCYH